LISQTQKEAILQSIQQRHGKLPVFTLSNVTQEGFDALKSMIVSGKTYCLLGSSGVGKSSMINVLSGKPLMQTDAISTATNKGRHITSHRELIVLEQGGILIDNPGMREVGIADNTNGLETTFDTLLSLGQTCRFKDCSHTNELGCAVIDALNKGEIDRDSYDNYLKMEREKAFFESTQAEVRKRDKDFGKMLKNYKKTMKKN
jgi:ribosome biogenesis GTPase